MQLKFLDPQVSDQTTLPNSWLDSHYHDLTYLFSELSSTITTKMNSTPSSGQQWGTKEAKHKQLWEEIQAEVFCNSWNGGMAYVLESMEASPKEAEARKLEAENVRKEPKGCGTEIAFTTMYMQPGGGPCGEYCSCGIDVEELEQVLAASGYRYT